MNRVRTRFAPSPTGYLHIGGLRTALYAYLYAKKHDGDYLLRIEDTDRTRLVDDSIQGLIDSLVKCDIVHDEGVFFENGEIAQKGEFAPYIQSERLEIYHKYIKQLLDEDKAYVCFCTKERLDDLREQQRIAKKITRYDGRCRNLDKEEVEKRIAAGESYVVRLKMPHNEKIVIEDPVKGKVVFDTNEVEDQVLLKADGFPTYHLAVVVDDHLMGISHAFRGEEWLPSTPKNLYLYKALGWEAPVIAHLPTILNTDKKKLSKRQGDVAVGDFLKKGYLVDALVNYLALVGWSPETNQEIFSKEELIKEFKLERVSKSGGIFDINKLNWFNSHYIREKDIEYIADLSIPYIVEAGFVTEEEAKEKREWLVKIVAAVRGNLDYLSQIVDHVGIFFGDNVKLENEQAEEMLKGETVPQLMEALKVKIAELDEINADTVKAMFKSIQNETGIKGKNLFMPTRVALTGQCHGPEMPDIFAILGKEAMLKRLEGLSK